MSESAAIPDLPDDWQKAGLFYRAENGIDFFNLAIPPEDTITDPRERESCRAFLVRALALLDAGPVPGEEPSKSARDQFIDVLRSRGMIRPGEEWVIDANLERYAHELAERQRASGRDDSCTGIGCCGEHGGVADLIDPYASAGPVGPDKETAR
jgi:hypothetical protein